MDFREDRFTVKAFDCRPDGLIKPNVLMQYLQEAAACHAEQLGVGFANLDRQDCFWVLVNLQIEMVRTPKWRDNITIRTWPSGCTRLLATREFVGADADGRELFRAASEWMVLDKHNSRPRNLHRLDLHLPPPGPQTPGLAPQRLQPAEGYAHAGTISVPFSALDFNGHVNNTEYVRWAMDGLHRQRGGSPELRSVRMTYLAEVFEGDTIEVLVAGEDPTHLRILERKSGAAGDTNVFLMEIAGHETKGL